jgi:site-specific recombinase XerD
MRTNFSLLFYIRKQTNYSGGPIAIYLRITVDGKRAEMATGRECDPAKWNNKAGRAMGTKDDIRTLNAFLDNLQSKVYEAHRDLCEGEEPITAEALKNKFLGRDEQAHMLLEVFREHNRKMAALVDTEFAAGTLERYEVSLRHTEAFLKHQYGVEDMDIRKVDHSFISEYDFYLRTVRKCANNSAVKYMKNFGKIIRICLSNGWITADPFANYKGRVKAIERVVLSEEELQRMAEKQFGTERLTQVRDVFLFCCFTGLAYADVKGLRMSQISKGVDGELWIFTNRQKTSVRSAIPLLPTAAALVAKYADHPLCINKDMPLPVPSNQKMNEYLKEIAEVCGINKTLTSHIARHTFATTVTLSNGVPIESVSKMLGHASLKQTQHYAKILDKKVSDDMRLLKKKFRVSGEILSNKTAEMKAYQ